MDAEEVETTMELQKKPRNENITEQEFLAKAFSQMKWNHGKLKPNARWRKMFHKIEKEKPTSLKN